MWGLSGPTPRVTFCVDKKSPKNHTEGETLSMGFLPRDPLFRDDTKGATPPLESPTGPPNILSDGGYSRRCVERTMF